MESISVSGLSADDNALANDLLKRLDERAPRNLVRSSYYDGKRAAHDLFVAHQGAYPAYYGRLGLVLGWSAKAVDALARRCHIDAFTWSDGNLDDLGFDQFADENMLYSELSAARTMALIHGVSFLINSEGRNGETPSLLHAKDALSCTGVWDYRLRKLSSALSITSRGEDGRVSAFTLYRPNVSIACERSAGGWSSKTGTHDYGVPVEPVMYRPQIRPFGASRITRPIMGLQDATLRALARLEGHMDAYSRPEMFILGATPDAFTDGERGVSWRAALGAIRGLPDAADAPQGLERADLKQFPAASPEPHLKHINALAKMFAREASLPDSATAIAEMTNPTSAESYDASQYELIAEGEGAIDDFTRPIARAVRRGLAILTRERVEPSSWASIRPAWRNPKYESRSQAADAGTKILSAVPGLSDSDVGLELLGLSASQIERWRADQRRARGAAVLSGLGLGEGGGAA